MDCAEQRSSRQIAGALCRATEEILWRDYCDKHPAPARLHRLHCRVGGGAATYYRPEGRFAHRVTYGWKMVADKRCEARAARWLSAREIAGRRYFDGALTLPTLLAHTCCHEFAHVLQAIQGLVSRGSIHNRHFYRILDGLHAGGAAQSVLAFIEQIAAAQGLVLAFEPAGEPLSGEEAVAAVQRGSRVSFDFRGRRIFAEVIRINRRTVTVRSLQPGGAVEDYRVPPECLALAANSWPPISLPRRPSSAL